MGYAGPTHAREARIIQSRNFEIVIHLKRENLLVELLLTFRL